MDHDEEVFAACAATDLLASLGSQLRLTRLRLRAAELHLLELTPEIIEGSIGYPAALVEQIRAGRREVAAMLAVLDQVTGHEDHAACA